MKNEDKGMLWWVELKTEGVEIESLPLDEVPKEGDVIETPVFIHKVLKSKIIDADNKTAECDCEVE